MPIYEYICQSCATRSEVIHGLHVPGPEVCELCGGRLRRAMSVPAIVFRGSGWAKNDARAAQRSSTTDSKTETDSKGDSSSDSKSDSKGDSKTPDSAPKRDSASGGEKKAPATSKGETGS